MNYSGRQVFLFMGLPGAGKTTLADKFHTLIGGARLNADHVRATISTDLRFTDDDRLVQAHRMGALAGVALRPYTMTHKVSQKTVDRLNRTAIVDFVCPTLGTYEEFIFSVRHFGLPPIDVTTIWMNTIKPDQSRFADTAKLFAKPDFADYTVQSWDKGPQLLDTLIQKYKLTPQPVLDSKA